MTHPVQICSTHWNFHLTNTNWFSSSHFLSRYSFFFFLPGKQTLLACFLLSHKPSLLGIVSMASPSCQMFLGELSSLVSTTSPLEAFLCCPPHFLLSLNVWRNSFFRRVQNSFVKYCIYRHLFRLYKYGLWKFPGAGNMILDFIVNVWFGVSSSAVKGSFRPSTVSGRQLTMIIVSQRKVLRERIVQAGTKVMRKRGEYVSVRTDLPFPNTAHVASRRCVVLESDVVASLIWKKVLEFLVKVWYDQFDYMGLSGLYDRMF